MANPQGLRNALATVKRGFKQQQEWYLGLPLEVRRDIRRPAPVDRFRCAAIFQHEPSTHGPFGYYVDGVENLDPEKTIHESSAEICPFTDHYDSNIEKAQEALDAGDYESGAQHVSEASKYLSEVHDMLLRMSRRPNTVLKEQDQWRTLWAWNDPCYWVQKGASVEDAIGRSLRVDRGGKWNDGHTKDNGPRQYFLWDPLDLTFAAKPMYVTDLPEINDIPMPIFRPTVEELKVIFTDFKKTWSAISPHESNFPHPLIIMREFEPEPAYLSGQSDNVFIKVVFLRGGGFESLTVRNPYIFEQEKFNLKPTDMEEPQFALRDRPPDLRALEKHLSRVELRRWHLDQLNKRSGIPCQVGQEIGQKEDNRAVFLALKDLVDMLRDPQKHFRHPMELDSR